MWPARCTSSSLCMIGQAHCLANTVRRISFMERIHTTAIPSHIGEQVRVTGWLHSWRQMGGIHFLVIRDGWGSVQAVAESEHEIAPLLESGATVESVIAVEARVVREAQAPGGAELHDLHIEIITPIREAPPVPINKRKLTTGLSTLLDHAPITDRHPSRRAVLRLAAGVMGSYRHLLNER